ncbi:hypothetical protein M5K25_012972 [Dendrobium thyrsiflorum]|uniref:Uncharacterized protein n=1 Tax=Dendrobium thyrsiflorum TaxID=117978 RepID=A0ABD0V5L0_DENTH
MDLAGQAVKKWNMAESGIWPKAGKSRITELVKTGLAGRVSPVVSLRENLIVMVHDEEGEEILRTEFKTMFLLERGLWDNLFPLKNGGSLHMKLQFFLSEEDRKRIREMRNSALKRRHLEKPGIRHRRSFSDDRIGYSPTRTFAEIGTEEMLLDHSESADLVKYSPSVKWRRQHIEEVVELCHLEGAEKMILPPDCGTKIVLVHDLWARAEEM